MFLMAFRHGGTDKTCNRKGFPEDCPIETSGDYPCQEPGEQSRGHMIIPLGNIVGLVTRTLLRVQGRETGPAHLEDIHSIKHALMLTPPFRLVLQGRSDDANPVIIRGVTKRDMLARIPGLVGMPLINNPRMHLDPWPLV